MADTNKLVANAILVVALSMVVQAVMYIGNMGIRLDCAVNANCGWDIVALVVIIVIVITSLAIAWKSMK
jgi:hypothetical protein